MKEKSEYTQGWESGYDAGLENGFSFGYQKAQIEMIQLAGKESSFEKAKEFLEKYKKQRDENESKETQ